MGTSGSMPRHATTAVPARARVPAPRAAAMDFSGRGSGAGGAGQAPDPDLIMDQARSDSLDGSHLVCRQRTQPASCAGHTLTSLRCTAQVKTEMANAYLQARAPACAAAAGERRVRLHRAATARRAPRAGVLHGASRCAVAARIASRRADADAPRRRLGRADGSRPLLRQVHHAPGDQHEQQRSGLHRQVLRPLHRRAWRRARRAPHARASAAAAVR